MMDLVDQILKRKEKLTDPELLNCSGYWMPLQWLYVEMVKINGIEPIGEIGQNEKSRYWRLTSDKDEQWKRICQVQALYVYDQIKNL